MSPKKKESESSNLSEEFLSSKAKIFFLLKISFVVFFLYSLTTIFVETYPKYQHKKYYDKKMNLAYSLEQEKGENLRAFYEQKWIAEHDTNIRVIKDIQPRIIEREIGDSVATDELECNIISLTKQKCKPVKKWVALGSVLDTVYDTTYTTPWKDANTRRLHMDANINRSVFNHCDSLAALTIHAPNTFFKPSEFDSTPAAIFSIGAMIISSFFFYCLFVFLKLHIYQITQTSESSRIKEVGELIFTDCSDIGIGLKHNLIICMIGSLCAVFWSMALYI